MEIDQSSSLNPDDRSTGALWRISLPLMISNFASLFMIFIDRIFLDYYSTSALISATSSGTWAWAFLGGFGMIASMSEIFVAQYFGAKREQTIGTAVWQMIWLSFFSIFVFLPLAFYAPPFLFRGEGSAAQSDYFSYLLLFGPFYTLMSALSGFYIGRGKTKILIYLAVLGNVLNIGLDGVFIFGVPSLFPEMGIKGAAIATSLGYIFQAITLFLLFLRPCHQHTFRTNHWRICPKLFYKSFRVGLPQGIFYMLEMMGFAIFYDLMSSASKDHIIISGICQSFLILLSFFIEGLSRGVTALSGNFIGAKEPRLVHQVLRSGIYLQCLFSLTIAIAFLMPSEWIMHLFPDATRYILSAESGSSMSTLWICLFCSFLYLFFEGIRWVIAGILTAAGDTLFLLIAGSCSVWAFLIFPIYFLILQNSLAIESAWAIFVAYSFISCSLYFWRFQKGCWQEIKLIEE